MLDDYKRGGSKYLHPVQKEVEWVSEYDRYLIIQLYSYIYNCNVSQAETLDDYFKSFL